MIHHLKTMVCPILFVMGFWTLAIAMDGLTKGTQINTCVQPTLTLRKMIHHQGVYKAGQLQGQFAQDTCAEKCETEMARYHDSRVSAHSSADICHAGENICYCVNGAYHSQMAEETPKAEEPGIDNIAGPSFLGFMPYGIPYWAYHVTDPGRMTNANPITVGMLDRAKLRISNKAKSKQQLQSIQCQCFMQVQYLKMRIQGFNLGSQLDEAEGTCGPSAIAKRHEIDSWQSLQPLDSMSGLPIFPCNNPINDQRFCSGVLLPQCKLYPSSINLEIPTAYS
ncbi:hypothetical protein BCR37DRAFT_383737 [Protomyces lactucae-debilis]|uniref:Uncharacterized protein n=1 Tax=Protomyces lactucae-debilis TaxID=2754530 RepID=A0A1Y2EXX2_PROLT|nr:uncharacterized protein BCR37DRAFT_383737 [Protomyces lactucae-debilis]ORY76084.1 hypothetical protein BCR37DRAFT_383737 [Protomyces lactucae-debilis]